MSRLSRTVPATLATFVALLVLAGCMAGPNPLTGSPLQGQSLAGFWTGLWQGFILWLTWLVSLFSDKVNIYEVHNSGGWYNFGYFLGAGGLIGLIRAIIGGIVGGADETRVAGAQ